MKYSRTLSLLFGLLLAAAGSSALAQHAGGHGGSGNHDSSDSALEWKAATPTVLLDTDELTPPEYEVRVYDLRHSRRLVAAVEIVSPELVESFAGSWQYGHARPFGNGGAARQQRRRGEEKTTKRGNHRLSSYRLGVGCGETRCQPPAHCLT